MSKALFIERNKTELIQVIKRKLEALSHAAPNQPNIIEERQRSIDILSGYESKDESGRPIEPRSDSGDAEISISDSQATILKIAGNTVPVRRLLSIVSAEVTSNPGRAVRDRMSCAADLIQKGTRSNSKHESRVQQYARALTAYNFLASWPRLARKANMELIAHGEKLLGLLTRGHAGSKLLLADVEYHALEAGEFLKFSGTQFYDQVQAERGYINDCVMNSHVYGATHPFVTLFDPVAVEAIEKMMNRDATARWLLEGIKKDNIPIIIHHYSVPNSTVLDQSTVFGTHIIAPSSSRERLQYVRLFLNALNHVDGATIGSHEVRHAWQNKVAALLDQRRASAVDGTVLEILQEADCNAVQDKVGWNLNRVTHQPGLVFNDYMRFESHFARYPKILTEETRMRLAMRDVFFDYLNEELGRLGYIKKSLRESVEKGLPLPQSRDMCRRALEDSLYLNSGFLRLVSQIGETHSYLDSDDIHRVISLIKSRLPDAMAQAARNLTLAAPQL